MKIKLGSVDSCGSTIIGFVENDSQSGWIYAIAIDGENYKVGKLSYEAWSFDEVYLEFIDFTVVSQGIIAAIDHMKYLIELDKNLS